MFLVSITSPIASIMTGLALRKETHIPLIDIQRLENLYKQCEALEKKCHELKIDVDSVLININLGNKAKSGVVYLSP